MATEPSLKSIRDLERLKFVLDDGEWHIRTFSKGSFTYSGLNNGGRVTEVTLNDTTWVALPTTALTDRNAISVVNNTNTEIKINYLDSIVGYVGVPVPANGERIYDITDAIVLYGKSESGSVTVIVEELS